ncbi:MAG: hypothetical protein Q4C75_01660, partial [Bergeyella zoohelcum]|nr:hypothetical protein [Bergeyella zoohelcum]
MKALSIIGIILLGLSVLVFYITVGFSSSEITFNISHIIGMMAGIGLGLIIGGLVGYISKGSAVKQEEQRKAYNQLQKEKT